MNKKCNVYGLKTIYTFKSKNKNKINSKIYKFDECMINNIVTADKYSQSNKQFNFIYYWC